MITNGETSIYTIDEIAYLTERYIKRCAIDGCKFLHLSDEEISKMAFDKSNFTSNNMNEADLIDLPSVFKIDTTIETDKVFSKEFFIAAVDTFLGRTDRPSQAKRKEIESDWRKLDTNDRVVVMSVLKLLGCYKACSAQFKNMVSVLDSTGNKTKKEKDEEKMKTKDYVLDFDRVMYLVVKIMKYNSVNKKGYTAISNKTIDDCYAIINQKYYYSDLAELPVKSLDNSVYISFAGDIKRLSGFTMTGLQFALMVNTKFNSSCVDPEERKRMRDILSNRLSPQCLLAEAIENTLKVILSDNDTEANTDNEEADSNTTKVKVRWFDGYIEEFDAVEARSGGEVLWIKLANGEDRWIPLTNVRWFSGLK